MVFFRSVLTPYSITVLNYELTYLPCGVLLSILVLIFELVIL